MMKKKQTKITRKEAIKKFGKYAAMTAVGTFIVLNPQKSAAQSPPTPVSYTHLRAHETS